jgi:[histone H3]-lysine9 N-trimethyltransferase SUV39H
MSCSHRTSSPQNHSCDPNCHLNPCYTNDGNFEKPLLTIFTQKNIVAGEELTLSYAEEDEEPDSQLSEHKRQECRCGAANCKRYIF